MKLKRNEARVIIKRLRTVIWWSMTGLLLLTVPLLISCSSPVGPAALPDPPPNESEATPPPQSSSEPTATPDVFDFLKPGNGQPGVPPSSRADGKSQVAVILDNEWIFIKNGGKLNLGNGLSVELFIDPYPPTRLRAFLDVYLAQEDAPVTDAEVDMVYDMLGMFHGPFDFVADNLGDGHYLITIDYIMFGAWDHRLTVYMPETNYELGVGILVFPTVLQ